VRLADWQVARGIDFAFHSLIIPTDVARYRRTIGCVRLPLNLCAGFVAARELPSNSMCQIGPLRAESHASRTKNGHRPLARRLRIVNAASQMLGRSPAVPSSGKELHVARDPCRIGVQDCQVR
jgi:hypothetical protein